LTDDNYDVLGEYFMGQSIGNTQRHAAMNQMMKSMMGEEGETQMHITLGKRSSGCDTNAPFPSGYGLPLMGWLMEGGGNPMMGYGGWGGFGFGWIFMIVFWILIILGVVALVRYLGNSGKTTKDDKTSLEILKERYAKGEINKKEFEEMKKDLG
ncbi:MAG: SHOCT domain-containing protein, partial [bacterium]|nr:SHOCT domain-containing protein [bacterium]